MNRGAWHTTVHGVANSQTQLKQLGTQLYHKKKKIPKLWVKLWKLKMQGLYPTRVLSTSQRHFHYLMWLLQQLTLWVNSHFIKDESETQTKWATCPNLDWKPNPSDSCHRAPGAHWAPKRLLTSNSTSYRSKTPITTPIKGSAHKSLDIL